MYTELHFSWMEKIAAPAFFTFLGAAIGFATSQLRDALNAKKDKKAFLRAVGMELDALSDQLDGTFIEVRGSRERLAAGGVGPQFAMSLRTSVFTGQIAKVRNVDDPLMLNVIPFYSDLGTLQQIFVAVNEISTEYETPDTSADQKDKIRPRLLSTIITLEDQIQVFGKRLRALRPELPTS